MHKYPFEHHPCWSNERKNLWERIHLPIARKCNLKCAFCDHKYGTKCHMSKPGFATKLFSVDEALDVLAHELKDRDNLHIAAISGPGEPLANDETFEFLSRAREEYEALEFCISTNGTLLEENLAKLVEYEVRTITVSLSAYKTGTVKKVYEWALFDGEKITGSSMAEEIVNRQIRGIFEAVSAGIHIKVNTILIPTVNEREIKGLSKILADLGVRMQNIIPLIPLDDMVNLRAPSEKELITARKCASKFLPQFFHCKQCRSDVVGIPGRDEIL